MGSAVEHKLLHLFVALLCGLFVIAASAPVHCAQESGKKHILILHSYHKGYRWTDSINEGIESSVRKDFPDFESHVEYMDTKRIFDKGHFENLYTLFRHKFRKQKFDIVFVSDDDAFRFAVTHHKELFPGTPVVFCGVNYFEDSMLRGRERFFTGVVESVDVQNTLGIALKLHPSAKRVVVINDTSTTGAALHKDVVEAIPGLKRRLDFVFLEDLDIADIIARVKKLPSDSIVLFLIFFRDHSGRIFSHDESFRMISRHITVPVYSLWDIYYGQGMIGGSLIEGFSHGEKAAKLGLRILHGEKPSRIPVVKKSPNRFMFDYRQMERFGIKASALPKGSTTINMPASFYSLNRKFIWGGAVTISALLYLVALLGLNVYNRKRAEQEIKRAYQMTRDILDRSPYGIFVVNREGMIDYVNPAMLEISGDSYQEFKGLDVRSVPAYMNLGISEKITAALGGAPFFMGPVEYTSHFGKKTTIRNFIGIPFKDQNESKALIFIEDVTAQKKAEQERAKLEVQLHHAQKMEAVGHLAGGIAHDFNNIMTAIVGYGDLLRMRVAGDDPRKAYVEQILDASQKATALTQRLLAFSRKQIINPKPVDLNEIVRRIERLLARLLGEDIETKTSLHREPLTIRADIGQIEQVLMNLATNARDAMPKGGVLAIQSGPVMVDESLIRAHPYMKGGGYALLSVSDEGMGIESGAIGKIFEPFFTTKEPGKGTGLGLSVVYGIVKQHDGFINVYSEPGKGTTFKIFLPLLAHASEGPIPEQSSQAAGSAIVNGVETVLVAEDDAHIRGLMKTVLVQFGYTIIEAADGEEAIKIFMDNRDAIQLVLIDVIMPKKNGKEVYDEIKKVKPDVRALFISGYTADIIHRKGILEEELNFISKPVSTNDLLRKVRGVLDKK